MLPIEILVVTDTVPASNLESLAEGLSELASLGLPALLECSSLSAGPRQPYSFVASPAEARYSGPTISAWLARRRRARAQAPERVDPSAPRVLRGLTAPHHTADTPTTTMAIGQT